MDKIKRKLINAGSAIATLAMLSPVIIIIQYDKFKTMDFWFWLIVSVLYDMYMYSIIKKEQYIEESKSLFFNVFNGKAVGSQTEEEKLRWYEVICVSMFMDYFNTEKDKSNGEELKNINYKNIDAKLTTPTKIYYDNKPNLQTNNTAPINENKSFIIMLSIIIIFILIIAFIYKMIK